MRAPLTFAAVCVGLCALAALSVVPALAAAEFWEGRPFASWSDKDVQRMLTDSPWSRQVSIVVPRAPRETGDDPSGRGGDEGRGGFPTPLPQLKLNVQWRSAQPMRQAMARREYGAAENIPSEVRETLERDDRVYVVIVLGLPMRYADAAAEARGETFLRRDGHPPIAATDGGPQKSGNGFALIFAFPRTDEIVPQDNEVEFVTRLGTLEIKRKFRLKDMVAGGRLQL